MMANLKYRGLQKWLSEIFWLVFSHLAAKMMSIFSYQICPNDFAEQQKN